MSEPIDLICSPPTSTSVTPSLASIPILTPTAPAAPNPMRIRPHVDIPSSLLNKQTDPCIDASPVGCPISPASYIALAADLTMTPIEALSPSSVDGDTAAEIAGPFSLPEAAMSSDTADGLVNSPPQWPVLESPSEPLRTRISISEPGGTFFPPILSSTGESSPTGPILIPRPPAIVASTIDALPIPILALPAVSTADRVRPHILARASHSEAITTSSPYSALTDGFSASLDVTIGPPTVDLGVGRRTSLTFKDAVGRRLGRGSCPTPPFCGVSDQTHGTGQTGTPKRYVYDATRKAQAASPILSPTTTGISRKPSWKITLPTLPALFGVSASMERLDVSDDSAAGDEDSGLLSAQDIAQAQGESMYGTGTDENAARRTVHNRTPYPMSDEEENTDPFSSFQGLASGKSKGLGRKSSAKKTGGGMRSSLDALHPSDRMHGPDFDAVSGSYSDSDKGDSEDDDNDTVGRALDGGEVRKSLLRSAGSGVRIPTPTVPDDDEDDIEFIDPFSGSRISVKEANSQILLNSGSRLSGSRLKPGNPVLVRKSSFGALSQNSSIPVSAADAVRSDGKGVGAVSGLPGSTSGSRASRFTSFFSRSRTPSATANTSAESAVIGKGVEGSHEAKRTRGEPEIAVSEAWVSAGMDKQWSADSQSATEGDGLLI